MIFVQTYPILAIGQIKVFDIYLSNNHYNRETPYSQYIQTILSLYHDINTFLKISLVTSNLHLLIVRFQNNIFGSTQYTHDIQIHKHALYIVLMSHLWIVHVRKRRNLIPHRKPLNTRIMFFNYDVSEQFRYH